jgi:hypothetical protein
MAKIEEKSLAYITADDIVTIGSIATIISSKMKKIMTAYSDPREYAKEIFKHLKHDHHIAAAFISFNLIHMDPQNEWASPDDFKTRLKKIIERETTVDTTSMSSLTMKKAVNNSDVYTDSKIINKALGLLMRNSKIIRIKSKKEMEDIRSRKIKELRGRPSFIKLPPNSINLKKIMSNPNQVGLIIKILKNFGLNRFLALVLEADYYVLKMNKNKVYETAWVYMKTNEDQMKEKEKTKPDWEAFKANTDNIFGQLDDFDEDKLKILFRKIADLMTEHPFFHPYILSFALSETLNC